MSEEHDTEIDSWVLKLKQLYDREPHKAKDFPGEEPDLHVYLKALKNELKDKGRTYTLIEPLFVGGTGILFRASHARLTQQQFVVKFNRPLDDYDDRMVVEHERVVLPEFDHANIIRPVDSGKINVSSKKALVSYLVEPYVDSKALGRYTRVPTPFAETGPNRVYGGYIMDQVQLRCPHNAVANTAVLRELLIDLTKLLRQWVSALKYIHDKGQVYLDVKPENTIVDNNGHLLIVDFGSVQKLGKGTKPVKVYYSDPYVDPLLDKSREKSTSQNRVIGSPAQADLKVEFDYYALGQSIFELLSEIAATHPYDFPQIPVFRALHFLATRLLNGRNDGQKQRLSGYPLSERFGGLRTGDYSSIRYVDLKDVLIDLEKEEGIWHPETIVPELNTYPKDSVKIVTDLVTAFTPRLHAMIEHPTFKRLKLVTQLGLIPLLYPTADHSRYDHILGTFTNTANYVKRLFNDSQNPIFRNLIGEDDIKAVLLAALLHDIGQYPLAHDLEEVQPRIFSHIKLSNELLQDDETKDSYGRSLRDLISREGDSNCWGVKPEWIIGILQARQLKSGLYEEPFNVQDFKVQMLSAVIDGPIDADKADYITRDTEQCKIKYGRNLDIERLVRVLTCVVYPDRYRPDYSRVTIGIYEKGRASAESFSFARYNLFESVYWHHASRELKAMLQYATALALPEDILRKGGFERETSQIQQNLKSYVMDLVPPYEKAALGNTFHALEAKEETASYLQEPIRNVIEDYASRPRARLQRKASEKWKLKDWSAGLSYTDWLILQWIGQFPGSPKQATSMLELIAQRKLYKRIHTLHRGGDQQNLISTIEKKCTEWPERLTICETIQEQIKKVIDSKETVSTGTEAFFKRNEIFANNLTIILDIPEPEAKIGFTRPLYFVPELRPKTYESGEQPIEAHDLEESVRRQMISIAPIRIFCHPTLRGLVRSLITPTMMSEFIERALA